MATLKLALYGPPPDELARTVDGDLPEWIQQLYASDGTSAKSAPASASVLALGEDLGFRLRKVALLLAKIEAHGWRIQPRQWDLPAHTDLDDAAAQSQLESAGVWLIAKEHAPLDDEGNVRWSHGILP